jgi:hypothetical protein
VIMGQWFAESSSKYRKPCRLARPAASTNCGRCCEH